MKKVESSRKAKRSVSSFLIALGIIGLVGTTPTLAVSALAAEQDTVVEADNAQDGDVLFVDNDDTDCTTEDIKESDTVDVDNNIVVPETTEETKDDTNTETTSEESTEEKTNDGGSCVTPENNYTEGEGEYWDPSIKTEEEKKGLNEDTPTPTPDEPTPTPDEPTPTPDEPTPTPDTPTPTPDEPTPTPDEPTPTPDTPEPTPDEPTPTPKTGVELDWAELIAVLAGCSLVAGGAAKIAGARAEEKEEEKILKKSR